MIVPTVTGESTVTVWFWVALPNSATAPMALGGVAGFQAAVFDQLLLKPFHTAVTGVNVTAR